MNITLAKILCFVRGHREQITARKEYPCCKPGEVIAFQGLKPEQIIMLTDRSSMSVPSEHTCIRCGNVRRDSRVHGFDLLGDR